MAEIKTTQNTASVEDYLNNIPHEQKRKDSFTILKMMQEASGEEPKMWGTSLIGFGFVHLKSAASGREVDWFRVGFAPRKSNFSLYLSEKLIKDETLMKKLGKHKSGMGCLYINKLDDVDQTVLKNLIVETLKTKHVGTL